VRESVKGKGIESLGSPVVAAGSDTHFAKEQPFRRLVMHGALDDLKQIRL
jgi:hypothetical protein